MLRKILRSIAKHNMEQQDISIFKKYSPATVLVKNGRSGNSSYREVMKSVFSRSWRAYCHD